MTTSTRKTLEEVVEILDRAGREEGARQDELALRTAENLVVTGESLRADLIDRMAYSRAALKHMVPTEDQDQVKHAIDELDECLSRLKQVRSADDLPPELLRDVTARMATVSKHLTDISKRTNGSSRD